MYELLILGQLARMPMHGYKMAKTIEKLLGPFRHAQWGALYPVLNRMMSEGLIQAQDAEPGEDGRARKVYSITDAGRDRLHDLLMDTEHHLADYATVFNYKVSLFAYLSSEERRRLARHYAVYAQQYLDHLERNRRHLEDGNTELDAVNLTNILTIVRHNVDRWKCELAWAEELIAAAEQQEVEPHVSPAH